MSSSFLSRFLLAALVALGTQAADPPAPPTVNSGMLVSTRWLSEHLKDPGVVVLHVADQFSDYKRGHIPGARFLATSKFIENAGALGTELPSLETLARTFGDLGIGDKARVVIYCTNWPPNAARAWFTLDYLGHGDRASLLDGGIEVWLAEDRPVTQALPAFASASFTPRVHAGARADLEEVRKVTETGGAGLVDSRPARRYAAGHLPGASSVYWQECLEGEDRPLFLPAERLRALLASRGVASGGRLITYCEVGLQASHGYFLARYLGYDAAMYDGSYQEWSAKNLPVVKAEAK